MLYGVLTGLALTALVGVLTFVAHRRLPYRRMLVFTGVMLGLVLLVMVGEQVQEMQLARWLPTTPVAHLQRIIPDWMGLWFAVFPTVESTRRPGPRRRARRRFLLHRAPAARADAHAGVAPRRTSHAARGTSHVARCTLHVSPPPL